MSLSAPRSSTEAASNDLLGVQHIMIDEEKASSGGFQSRTQPLSADTRSPNLFWCPMPLCAQTCFYEAVASAVGASTQSVGKQLAAGSGGLPALHHMATYQRALCRLLELSVAPLLRSFEARAAQARLRAAQLEDERKELEGLAASLGIKL